MESIKLLFLKIRFWTAGLFGLLLHLNIFKVRFPNICAPTYSCHGCPWASFGCPAGAAAFQFSIGKFPAAIIGTMLLIGAAAGRIVCGFLCPVGLFQDVIHKIPSKKLKLPKWIGFIKYGVLALLVIILPFLMGHDQSGYLEFTKIEVLKNEHGKRYPQATVINNGNKPVVNPEIEFFVKNKDGKTISKKSKVFNITIHPGETAVFAGDPPKLTWAKSINAASSPQAAPSQDIPIPYLYYCRICPVGTLTAAIPTAIEKKSFINLIKESFPRIAVLLFFLIGAVFISRLFCRAFCPIGAFYALTNQFALFRPSIDKTLCVQCGKCSQICPVGLNVPEDIGSPECLACGDCMKICPKKALKREFAFLNDSADKTNGKQNKKE